MTCEEGQRVAGLVAAQEKAIALFHEVEARGLVEPGAGELPYRESPPARVIGEDDVAFADFGPIFEEHEADFGRPYVFGDDPDKHRLLRDLPQIFDAGRAAFAADPDITGRRLFAEVERLASDAVWEIGIWHAGHLVGEFPHGQIDGAKAESCITPDNDTPLRCIDRAGRTCHWILELHFVDLA